MPLVGHKESGGGVDDVEFVLERSGVDHNVSSCIDCYMVSLCVICRSHAGNKLAMQEFMILPTGADDFHHAMRIGAEGMCCLVGWVG